MSCTPHVKAQPVRDNWRVATQERIDDQAAIVAKLRPGSKVHQLAASILLLLQDSQFELSQAYMMVAVARQSSADLRKY